MSEERKILLPSALSIYEKDQQQQLNYNDLGRTDLHFRMRTGADILIEENGIHVQNPFKFDVAALAKWSNDQNDNIDVVLKNYAKYFEATSERYKKDSRPIYRPYLSTDGFDDNLDLSKLKPQQRYQAIIKYCRSRIFELRKYDESIDALAEIDHRRNNIFEVLYYLSNQNLDDLMIKTYVDDLCMTNRHTILQNFRERGPKQDDKDPNKILPATYAHKQRTYTLGEIVEMLKSPELNTRTKDDKLLVIPNTTGDREVGEQAYCNWSGLQIFDVDLKFSPTFISKNLDAAELRDILFDQLKHYPWLVAITLSSSGKALHIYTKVSRPHKLFKSDEHNIDIMKYWYRMSYVQKYAAITYTLFHHCDIDIYDEQNRKKNKVMDSSLARVQQGIAMNHDPGAKFNHNFIDLPPQLFYHLPPEEGVDLNEWLTTDHIQQEFSAWFYDAAKNDETNVDVTKREGDLKITVDTTYKLDKIAQIDMNALGKGEKYSTRWRVCNTLIASYGDTPQATELAHHILQSSKTGTIGQVNSFLRSAVLNNKEADVYMLKELRKLGLKIMLDDESTKQLADDNMEKIRYMIEKSNYEFRQHVPNEIVSLADDEYLGMRMQQVLNAFDEFKINVIESAPNTGKTEFFKSLAKTKAVCLVIPFTSTIESKIVNDESINALFDVYFGDRSVSELTKGRSAVMTFDKFSRIPKSKYKLFDYIAIDESHLLFTSTYRLPVVSQTVENIRNYLLKDTAVIKNSMSSIMSVQHLMSFVETPETNLELPKFILMTGTPTGELDYFRFYEILNYIKVQKKHPHKKDVEFILSKSSGTRDVLIFKQIAEALTRGGKIIHPTNNGDGYARKVVDCVEHLIGRKVKWEYYKRANTDELFLERINKDTTVDDVELLFCSDYLSVGIDIKDVGDFEIVFSSDFTAENIEQFNNRLRSTDINCKIFFDVLSEDGMQKANIMNLSQIEYKATAEFRNMIQDEMTIAKIQQHVNSKSQWHAVIGEMFSRYFILDHFGNIKYVQAAFEIERFEESYKEIAKSLLYIKTAMQKKYQYNVDVSFKPEVSEDELESFKEIQKAAKAEYDLQKSTSMLQVVEFVSTNTVYDKLVCNDYKTIKISDEIPDEEIGLHLSYDSSIEDGQWIVSYNRKHKIMFHESLKIAMKLRKLYSFDTVQEIMRSCTPNSGIVKRVDVYRYMNLMKLMFDDRKSALAGNTKEMLNIAYEYIIPENGKQKLDRWEYEEMKMKMKLSVENGVKSITDTELVSERRKNNVDTLINKFVDTLFHKRISQDTVSIEFRQVYAFDSKHVNERIQRDQIFRRLLLDDHTEVDPNELHDISESHITDTNQFVV